MASLFSAVRVCNGFPGFDLPAVDKRGIAVNYGSRRPTAVHLRPRLSRRSIPNTYLEK